ncbi:MAG: hypothetical protein LBL45_01645 [Treponema sp.]|jgi:hypothetical protein|nr:hypothetical protein [Treponema sp.]
MISSKPGQTVPDQTAVGQINRFQTHREESADERPDFLDPRAVPRNPFYRVLSLYLPWSILVCLLPAGLALIHRLLPDISLFGPSLALAIYAPALLVSAAVTIYLEFLDPRTSHNAAHIRGGILSIAAAYLTSSLLSFRLPLNLSGIARQFFPAPGNITATLAALYIWVFVIRLRRLFRARELFERHLRHHQGEELRRFMLENASVMAAAETQSRLTIRRYSIQLGIVFTLALACGFLKAPLSLFQRTLTMIVIVMAAVIFSLLNQFRYEQRFAGEGIAVPAPERHNRIGAGILFCAAAGLLAVLCASNNNLLPISIIAAFFAWLARLLIRPKQPIERPPELPDQAPAMPLDAPSLIESLGVKETEPWPFWNYLFYIALTLIIAAFLGFMVKPLFTIKASSGKIPFLLKVIRLFRSGLFGLKRALRNFFGSLGRSPATRISVSDGDLQSVTDDLMSAWSKARRRELRQSLSLFARLILWGERNCHTSWKPSMGPGEFCALLASATTRTSLGSDHEGRILVSAMPPPGQSPVTSLAILRCGEIFEEALYGPGPPDKETQREFRRLVEDITK